MGFFHQMHQEKSKAQQYLMTAALEVFKVLFMYRRKCFLSQGAYLRPE